MKRAVIMIILGVLLAALAGMAAYLQRTAPERAMLCCTNPEFAWLQHEFQMTDDQLARVQKLNEGYQMGCMELCRRIRATNDLVRVEFTRQGADPLKLQRLLAGAAQLRGECQWHMLEYCQAVSREMPPQQGTRYLQWVCDRVLRMPGNAAMAESSQSGHGN